jgi:hypothetical protein
VELVFLGRRFGECTNLFFGLSLILRKGHPFANEFSARFVVFHVRGSLAQFLSAPKGQLRVLAAESAHRVTGVASFILLADIGDQRLRALHLDFEGGDQRIFRINDDVSRFSLNFKADCKLHLCSPLSTFKR